MKAMVYGGPGNKSWTDVPDPAIINPGDAIIQVDAVTICGTDLHILRATSGYRRTVLGHEAVGTVATSAAASTRRAPATACSSPASRPAAGAATAARAATASASAAAAGSSATPSTACRPSSSASRSPTCPYTLAAAVSATRPRCCSPTSCPRPTRSASATGQVRPSDTVVIVGASPIGLAAVMTARLYSPRPSSSSTRPRPARGRQGLGADITLRADRHPRGPRR